MFRRKQIVVLSLVLMIIVAGYLQYSYNKSSFSTTNKDDERLGEAVYVDNIEGDSLKNDIVTDVTNQEANAVDESSDDAQISASKLTEDYFAQAKVDKDVSTGKSTEKLKQITEDENADRDIKSKAYDTMIQLAKTSELEAKIESLIKQKEFQDALVYFGEDGSVDVVVKAPSLTSAQTAQISDIVARQAKVDIQNIHIKNMY